MLLGVPVVLEYVLLNGSNKITIMDIALIKNGKVENIIVADFDFAQKLGYEKVIDVTNKKVGIGDTWDGVNFIPPEITVPDITKSILTKYEFLTKFTIEERIGIYTAELSNPLIRMWLDIFRISDNIDLSNADTISGVGILAVNGFITKKRATEILTS